jgi:hypothetical protein
MLGATRFAIREGMLAKINTMNKTNPWPRRLFQSFFIGIDHMRLVRKLLRPPTMNKSTMNPIMSPMTKPVKTNTTRRKAHRRDSAKNNTENKSPCRKYFSRIFHQGSISVIVVTLNGLWDAIGYKKLAF